MKPARWLMCVLLGGSLPWLGACAVRANADSGQPMPEASVTLERSTCFGNCPAYSVTAQADGQVSFTGHAHVQTTQAAGRATPAQLAAIHAALAQADFTAMRPSYTSRDDGCEMMMSDQPGIKITVDDARGSHSVDFYLGCTGAAADAVRPRIEQLAKAIDQQLQTGRWIGTPKPPGAVEHAER
ncbi:hypothetical protein ACVWWQ_001883 [Rhodanobacter sp. TND4EL1]